MTDFGGLPIVWDPLVPETDAEGNRLAGVVVTYPVTGEKRLHVRPRPLCVAKPDSE